MRRFATTLFIILLIGSMTSCHIYDSYIDCNRGQDVVLEFKYFADNKDRANVIAKFITGGVLYVYDNSTGNLIDKYKLTKEELKNGKHLRLENGKYKFICWGNQSKESRVIDEAALNSARISSPSFYKNEKIRSNDPLYYTSKTLNIGSSEQQNGNQQTEVKGTLIFQNVHKSFRIRVFGIKNVQNLGLEITNLMPEYNFEMQAAAPFKTPYYPVITNSGTEGSDDYREFDFSVLQFKKENSKNIYVKLMNGDNNKILAPVMSLYELLIKNNINLENRQEITIEIDYKFSDTGVTVEVKEWKNEPTTPST